MDSIDDAYLLQKLRRGDPQAMGDLLDRYGDKLYSQAFHYLGRRPENRTDAEDLVQETIIGAFKSAKRFEGRSSLSTWLSRILANQVAAFIRSRKVRRADTLPEGISDHRVDPDAEMDVRQMLEALTDEHRQVIVLRELEGRTYDEIAEILNVPRGTVESRLHRARQALRDRFRPKSDD